MAVLPADVPAAVAVAEPSAGSVARQLVRPWSWLAAALLLVAVRLPVFQLWGDVRFTLGVERVTGRTGWPASEVWAHRPLLNRQLMAALDQLTGGPLREQQLLLWGTLGCALVVWALHRSLSSRLGSWESAGLCGGLLVALLWTSSRNLLQPEWFAVLAGIAAVAVGAARTRPSAVAEWAVAAMAGSFLSAAVLMKWTTIGTAAAAWVVLLALLWRQRRRLIQLTVAAAVLTPLVLGLQVLLVPHEGVWLLEMTHLNPDPGALRWCSLATAPIKECGLQNVLANELVVAPVLLLLPAAAVLLVRTSTGLRRLAVLTVPTAGLAATLATTIVQGQWFGYHLTAAAIIAGAWLGWALVRWARLTGRPAYALIGPALVAGPLLAVLLSLPVRLRTSVEPRWFGATPAYATFLLALGIGVVAIVLALLVSGRPAGGRDRRPVTWTVAVSALAVVAVFVNPVLPRTGFTFDFTGADQTMTTEQGKHATYTELADRVHTRIGADTPVVYLAFGEMAYWVANPTYCRYAAATFLQRSRWVPTRTLRGFTENLACLSDPRAAYAVIQPSWLSLPRTDPLVRREVDQQFDCGHAVVETTTVLVCPRRG